MYYIEEQMNTRNNMLLTLNLKSTKPSSHIQRKTHLLKMNSLVVHRVIRRVVPKRRPGHHKLRIRNRLERTVFLVNDLLKMHPDRAAVRVRMLRRTVQQNGQLLRANLLRSVAEHEEHRIDHVTLAASVGADNCREALVKRTQHHMTGVAFEVVVRYVRDD